MNDKDVGAREARDAGARNDPDAEMRSAHDYWCAAHLHSALREQKAQGPCDCHMRAITEAIAAEREACDWEWAQAVNISTAEKWDQRDILTQFKGIRNRNEAAWIRERASVSPGSAGAIARSEVSDETRNRAIPGAAGPPDGEAPLVASVVVECVKCSGRVGADYYAPYHEHCLAEEMAALRAVAEAAKKFIARERVGRAYLRAVTLMLYGAETQDEALAAKRQAQIDLEDAVDALAVKRG